MQDQGVQASFEEVFALVKQSLERCARVFAARYPSITEESFLSAYRRHAEEESIDGAHPFPGAGEVLRAVIEQGGKNYLYTHRGESLFAFLDKEGWLPLFYDRVTGLDDFPRKPAPDALIYLTGKHHLPLEECVMIGDRDIDLDAGKKAGMAGALFDPDGFYPQYETPWRFQTLDGLRQTLVDGAQP